MHILSMSLLVYVAVNLDQLSDDNKSPAERAMSYNRSGTPDAAFVQQVLEVDIGEPIRLDDGEPDQPVINIQVTNMSYWLTVFVIKARDNSLPTRSEINVALLYSAVSLVISVLAICSITKVQQLSLLNSYSHILSFKQNRYHYIQEKTLRGKTIVQNN